MTPYKIATLTRKACDLYNAKKGDFSSDLNGMCAIASHLLFLNLKEYGYKPEFLVATFGFGSHCWDRVDDLHLDITATQFAGWKQPNIPPVHKWKAKAIDSNQPLLNAYGSWGATSFDYLHAKSDAGIIKLIKGWHPPQGITKVVTRKLQKQFEELVK